MTRQVEATIDIDAPPEQVWDALVGFEEYGAWNPLVRRIRGRPEVGGRLNVLLTQRRMPPVFTRPVVSAVVPERELRWTTEPPIPGVIDAEHAFRLDPKGERTRFTQREWFRGALADVVVDRLGDRLVDGFDEMNRALKRYVEGRQTVEIAVSEGDHRNR
ncbi:hypothetical protein AUR64_04640 [Haloprofundus marisrubri]|uniref:Polyketide cyclase n=1 Tax=Haloprofundus marisrubri TaxID=1514971 RepID=A0A0W1RCT7_9EURY|nr:SRPBCC domain-containing protein [Haloprofundus marisrubri]KTG11220.1 hypothetical protein AUR64_04640 [Haloprofundus marisrubri]